MRKITTLTGLTMMIAVLGLLGCTTNTPITAPAQEAPPDLPAVSTMEMNLGLFESARVSTQSIERGALVAPAPASPDAFKLNFLNAAVRVLFLDVVVYSALAHPVAAFATAIHSVPQYQQDGSWLWTYIFVDEQGTEYSIFLAARPGETAVAWSMEVSSNDPAMPLDHFLWFDGEAEKDERAGYWQFYEPVADAAAAASTDGIPCIRIDWRNTTPVDQRLAFLVNKPDVEDNGTTLVFEETPEMATVEFFDAKDATTGTIRWRPDGSGSIEWPDYNDGAMGCWDVTQHDADCP